MYIKTVFFPSKPFTGILDKLAALMLLYLVEYVKFALFVNRPLFDVGSYGERRNDKCGVSDYRVATLLPSPAT